ncbi:MAG: hypothetical protein PWQ96_763 [Clostridia bacterium]|jgi:predicted nucleotidyltransferase|nr:polymerase beta domain protein region [Clostridiales bacterium]MDK2985121.1 hypothetical protein [Clostridia bacterium]
MQYLNNKHITSKLFSKEFADFCVNNEIRLAVLFGSQVSGETREDSDFDIAILIDKSSYPQASIEIGKLKRKLIRELSLFFETSKIDLVLLNRASPLLKFQVARTGKVIYQKNRSEFADFASLSLRQHIDARLFYQLDEIYLKNNI